IHLLDERARLTNRLQAVLEDATLKRAAVGTHGRGVSARVILDALIGAETDSHVLAELARGRRRRKRDLLPKPGSVASLPTRRSCSASSSLIGTLWKRRVRGCASRLTSAWLPSARRWPYSTPFRGEPTHRPGAGC